ncbi:MAG: hypothetical protein WDW38_001913 [Sanguina aurantia]
MELGRTEPLIKAKYAPATYSNGTGGVNGYGSTADRASHIFRIYDISGRNALDHSSMIMALGDLEVLNGLTAPRVAEILCLTNEHASRGRYYSLPEFKDFVDRLVAHHGKMGRDERVQGSGRHTTVPEGAERSELLQRVYTNYSKYTVGQGRLIYDEANPKLSSTQFVKLCQDLGLLQPMGPLNVVTVDLIFHKCKPIGGRRFHFPHYLKALAAIAQDSGHNVFELIGLLGMQIKPHALVFEKPLILPHRQSLQGEDDFPRRMSSNLLPPLQPRLAFGSPPVKEKEVVLDTWSDPVSAPGWMQDLLGRVAVLEAELLAVQSQEAAARAELEASFQAQTAAAVETAAALANAAAAAMESAANDAELFMRTGSGREPAPGVKCGTAAEQVCVGLC